MNIKQMLYAMWQKTKEKPEWEIVFPTSSKLTDGYCRAIKDKQTGVIKLEGYFKATTNINTSDILFTLPEKYRPPLQIGIPCMITTTTTTAAYYVLINPDGKMTQPLGSIIREGMFVGTIPL